MEINVFLEKLFEKSEKTDIGVMGDDGNIIRKEGRKFRELSLTHIIMKKKDMLLILQTIG